MLLERLSWGMALGTEATDYWFHYFGESKAILLRLTLVVLLIDGLLNLVRSDESTLVTAHSVS